MEFKIGDFVKLRDSGERFWVIVEGQSDEGWMGKVNNNTIVSPYKFGDAIAFRTEDVLDVYKPQDPAAK